MIKFSVIIPVYNMEKSIERTVQALLNQTYKNYEIILIDDGSKDNSGKICDSLSEKNNLIKVIHTNNNGAGPARNEGINIATGDYAYFPDADDLVDERTFEILSNIVKEKTTDLVVFGYKVIERNGSKFFEKKYTNIEFEGQFIRNSYNDFCSMDAKFGIQGAPWNKLFNLKIIKKYKIYFPSLRRHQDEAFIGRYVNYISKVNFISEVLYTYYANDLKKEWDKYPLNYIDAVNGLYEERKSNLLIWNEKDIETHNHVYREYICNFIKALEISFSPKFKFSYEERIEWIKNILKKNTIYKKIPHCKKIDIYHKSVYFFIKKKLIHIAYVLMSFKIKVQLHI